jgi:alpha-L-rhamnosidase
MKNYWQERSVILFLLMFMTSPGTFAQDEPWISYPSANVSGYGVYHFRKKISFEQVPGQLLIDVSADNRYQLFVNGTRVCYGPAKGDLHTYKYDVLDISPYLHEGENQLAALVYNGGKDRALALQSVQTAFLLRSEEEQYAEINTGKSWKVLKNQAYAPVSYYEMLFKERWFYGFYACGPGDHVIAELYPWRWEMPDFDDTAWRYAEELSFDGESPWRLVPRNIPLMDSYWVSPASIRLSEGTSGTSGFLSGESRIRIPVNTKARILFDFKLFTMGYPELTVVEGKGSSIKIRYAEALYEEVNLKAHRDSVEGKIMFGVWDLFQPDGEKRIFRPLWKRAFRYIELEIETGDNPLEIYSLSSEYSGYPYPEMATFKSDDTLLNRVFEMCQRTLRMCSGETYYDTPYYEQLNYGGDNRPIAAISTYNSTDDRLLREAMRLYSQSENEETGLFKSAYPSRFTFDQGTWSLAWIQSLHDYYFMRGDSAYIRQFTGKIEGILGFYHRHLDEKLGILGEIKCRNFIDWSITQGNIPRQIEEGIILHSTMLTLYYVHTLDCAARLFREIGESERAGQWETEARQIKEAVRENSYDAGRGLYTDYPDRQVFSQHTNVLAILCNVAHPGEQKELMKRILECQEFDEYASSYFSFLLFKAMQQTGMEDDFLDHLEFWYDFIDRGLTTCGETGFASHDRSDCHAWSAHPAYFLLNLVCGIHPSDAGFNRVSITPHPGRLKSISASMPHPKGKISVRYQSEPGGFYAEIVLPEGIEGEFEYHGHKFEISQGINRIHTQ